MFAARSAEQRAVEAEAEAKGRQAEAERLSRALSDLIGLTDPTVVLQPGLTVRELLGHCAGPVADSLVAYPKAEMRIRATVGQAYAALGDRANAEPQLRRALQLADEHAKHAEHPDPLGYDIAYSLVWLLPPGDEYFQLGARVWREGAELLARRRPRLAALFTTLSGSVQREAIEEVHRLQPQLFAALDEAGILLDPEARLVADQLWIAGYVLWVQQRRSVAAAFVQRALDLRQRLLPPLHPEIAIPSELLVHIELDRGRIEEARALAVQALALRERVLPRGHWRRAASRLLVEVCNAGSGMSEHSEQVVLAAQQEVLAAWGPDDFYVAETFDAVAQFYLGEGRADLAAAQWERLATEGPDNLALHWRLGERILVRTAPELLKDLREMRNHLSIGDPEQGRSWERLQTRIRQTFVDGQDPCAQGCAHLLWSLGLMTPLELKQSGSGELVARILREASMLLCTHEAAAGRKRARLLVELAFAANACGRFNQGAECARAASRLVPEGEERLRMLTQLALAASLLGSKDSEGEQLLRSVEKSLLARDASAGRWAFRTAYRWMEAARLARRDREWVRRCCKAAIEGALHEHRPDSHAGWLLQAASWQLACLAPAVEVHPLALQGAGRAVEIEPENPQGLATLGAALHRTGRHREAVEALQRSAAVIGDRSVERGAFLAMALDRLGRHDEAILALRGARQEAHRQSSVSSRSEEHELLAEAAALIEPR